MKKRLLLLISFLLFLYIGFPVNAQSLFPEKDKYIIVIDPGHGGDNHGTISNENFTEKDIIMKTAIALVAELTKYDEIDVYMTRTEDVDLSLTERAVFAKKVNADFVFSLHYNASENHTLFGTEVWIPLHAPYHSYGYKFAYLQQLEMQELGLFSRGIKTRINETNSDYYGIIRECVARNIPAVIIEHCHVDEDRDIPFCDEDSDYEELGRRDAIAIAKFLGLHDEMNTVPKQLYDIRDKDIIQSTNLDRSGPSTCEIAVENADYENGILTISVTAEDKQTPVMYYTYSIDGGKTFSKFYQWPDCDMLSEKYNQTISLMLSIPDGFKPTVIVRAYNKNEIYKTSNKLKNLEAFVSPTAPPAYVAKETPDPPEVKVPSKMDSFIEEVFAIEELSDEELEVFEISILRFVLLMIFVIIWMTLLVIMVFFLYHIYLNKKKRK